MQEYTTIKQQLEQIHHEYAMGVQLRSKAKHIEETAENLSFFSKAETANYNTKYIRSLYSSKDELLTKPDSILQEQELFYKTLYTEPANLVIDDKMFNLPAIPKLDEEQIDTCDSEITLEELGKALKEMANKKSPGTDGFTTEFYKFFWIDIKEIILKSIKYAFENNSLSIEQKRGILSIIPKKGKDLRRLPNWRPLTLLNTDYKILTKVLATRLQKVLPTLISLDQSGYIKGRFIGENIRNIYDVIEYTTLEQKAGMLVALDFEKAFDSISWPFLFKTLESFNFGPNFKKWIKVLYSNPQSCVINNGHYSSFFNTTRGIRQGCPISALLFILVVEIMAINIRENKKIKGINCGNSTIKIGQLADDTILYLKDQESLVECLEFIKHFSKSSGLKLNTSKSEAFWIGSQINCTEKLCGLKWTNSMIKCLGIWCGPDIEGAIERNFRDKLKNLKTVLNIWSLRKLSLKGKISVIRSFALPQVLYVTSILHTPDWFIEDVDRLFLDFLWSKKKHHVSKDLIIKEIQEGGLKMPLFSAMVTAIKCTWIKRMLTYEQYRLDILRYFIKYKSCEVKELITSKLDIELIEVNSAFYRQILKCWYSVYSTEPVLSQEVNIMPLWHNKFLLQGGRPYKNVVWKNHGIELMSHLLTADGKLLSKADIERKYSFNIKQMDYNCITHSIPRTWLALVSNKTVYVKDNFPAFIKVENKLLPISEVKCRIFYWLCICKQQCCVKSQSKWEGYLHKPNIEWEELYKIPFNVTRDTTLQSFQYKIFHRFFPCNYTLSVWYRDHKQCCTFCKDIDYPEHYFYHCRDTMAFWKSVQTWLRAIIGVEIHLNVDEVLFGIYNANNDNVFDIYNMCILHGKWFIYTCKRDERQICFLTYIKFIKNKLQIEKCSSEISQDGAFEKKWSALYECI